ncbi:MAG TPA: hypothetical protein VJ985_03115 [Gammaproteobacteria bacterium]|nr:hypothetical protein [Gammaproteobacteria bacterium]
MHGIVHTARRNAGFGRGLLALWVVLWALAVLGPCAAMAAGADHAACQHAGHHGGDGDAPCFHGDAAAPDGVQAGDRAVAAPDLAILPQAAIQPAQDRRPAPRAVRAYTAHPQPPPYLRLQRLLI